MRQSVSRGVTHIGRSATKSIRNAKSCAEAKIGFADERAHSFETDRRHLQRLIDISDKGMRDTRICRVTPQPMPRPRFTHMLREHRQRLDSVRGKAIECVLDHGTCIESPVGIAHFYERLLTTEGDVQASFVRHVLASSGEWREESGE